MSVAVSGGCDHSHSRPVNHGAPVKVWALTCEPCEEVLSGRAGGQKSYRVGDDGKLLTNQPRIYSGDPNWSASPTDIPLSPQEDEYREKIKKTGRTQLEAMQAMAVAASLNMPVPDAVASLYGGVVAAQEDLGTLCKNGHGNSRGAVFCSRCGVALAEDSDDAPEETPDYSTLSVAELRVALEVRGLPVNGNKSDLVKRLQEGA